MLQHVIIDYFRSRNVYIDGNISGKTNTRLRVDEGTHIFDLGPVKNYKPTSIKRKVSGTTSLKPMKFHFEYDPKE